MSFDDYKTPLSLVDLDHEVAARVAARLPEIIWSVIDRVDGAPTAHGQHYGPWWCNKPGWRHWCAKHNGTLCDYTKAAIDLHRVKRRWKRGVSLYSNVESADFACEALQRRYHDTPCTCFVEAEQEARRQEQQQRAKRNHDGHGHEHGRRAAGEG